jgi:hypothetical protein
LDGARKFKSKGEAKMSETVHDIVKKMQFGNIAVFKINGVVSSFPTVGTLKFNLMVNDYPDEFLGVFNKYAEIDVIRENLKLF